MHDDGLYAAMVRRGMSRRSFLKLSAAMTAALALPATYAPRIAEGLTTAKRIPVIWVRGQACGGDTEAFLRAADPTTASLLLDVLSVEYHDSLLAVAGADASTARTNAMAKYPNGYYAVVEGAIPSGAGGAFCLVGGRPIADIAREVCAGAIATIAVGSCAFDGGAPAAVGGPTDAGGVRRVVGDGKLVMLPGCPINVVNLAAVIVHDLAFGKLPPLDMMGRPLSAYGNLIHNQCERRPHFEFGEFAQEWGDEGTQKGWCLYKLGCKGPETMANCPTVRYGQHVSWNVRAGHGCIGCTTTSFWNAMGPAYKRLPSPIPFLPNVTNDQVGAVMVGGIGAVAGVHAVGMAARYKRQAAVERRRAASAAAAPASVEAAAAPIEAPAPPETPVAAPVEGPAPDTATDVPAQPEER